MEKLKKYLIENENLNENRINSIVSESKKNKDEFLRLLVNRGVIDENKLLGAYSKVYRVKTVNLREYIVKSDIVHILPKELAEEYKAVVFSKKGNKILVAMTDPYDLNIKDNIALKTGYEVETYYAFPFAIEEFIKENYGATNKEIEEMLESFNVDLQEIVTNVEENVETENVQLLLESSEQPAVVKYVNKIILEAVMKNASDIHFEPLPNYMQVRYRIDGTPVISDNRIPKQLIPSIISRIKIMAKLDIAERRRPQDGKISVVVGDKPVEIRVATSNTILGEEATMRIIDMSKSFNDISEAGFNEEIVKGMYELIEKPYGIILISGPTGSGKTSTLYSILNKLNTPEKVILTVEDPVERQVEGLRQHQVTPIVGFNDYLESFLRHDPDIIMIGEIRDEDTTSTAVRAALTGHLVIGTIHANNAASTVTRLLDMGIPAYLVSGAMLGVLAQRLVRKLCPYCKQEYKLTESDKEFLKQYTNKNIDNIKFYKPVGCEQCHNIGYKGRMVVGELLKITTEIRKMLIEGKTDVEIQNLAREKGFKTMVDDAIEKLLSGETSIEEVRKVTYTM